MTISNNQQQSATISNNQPDTTAQYSTLNTPHNATLIADKLTALRQILPEIFSETKLDFDKLRQLLGEHIADGERYGLNWAGKSHAYRTLQSPTNDTLAPCIDDSVDFDNTQNLFIESDNLQALKLLQKSYAGQIKMIYIDPPYNTGNDSFIYDDNFKQTIKDYEKSTGDRDDDGNRLRDFKKNSKDSGHYHSNWLNMMLPRLHLARTLLKDDGVIFISIDDNEQAQLKLLCDEIFGAENFRNQIAVKRGSKSVQAQFENIDKLGIAYEYILVYTKKSDYRLPKFYFDLEEQKEGSWNNHWRGTNRPSMRYEILGINIKEGQWRWSKKRSLEAIENYNNLIKDLGVDALQSDIDDWYLRNNEPDLLRLSKTGKPEHFVPPSNSKFGHNLWTDLLVGRSSSLSYLGLNLFDNPKNPNLIIRQLKWLTEFSNNDIILDFFAGSATTAHAVMQLNAEDDGKRQFIMVQLPEPTDSKSEAHKAGFNTIAEISKERIRRAGAKIDADNPDKNIDTGFKVFKLSPSNFKQWQSHDGMTADEFISQLAMFADSPLIENAVPIHVVYELLLRMGLKLTANIQEINGIYWIKCDTGNYAIILNKLDQDNMMAIINQRPNKTVMLDTVFETDSQKSNVILQFKDAGLDLETI